jgi:hypothetical protein
MIDYRCFVMRLEAIYKNIKMAYQYWTVDRNIVSHGFKVQDLISSEVRYSVSVKESLYYVGGMCCNNKGLGL